MFPSLLVQAIEHVLHMDLQILPFLWLGLPHYPNSLSILVIGPTLHIQELILIFYRLQIQNACSTLTRWFLGTPFGLCPLHS